MAVTVSFEDHLQTTTPRLAAGSDDWQRLARLAKLLSVLTLVWLGIEGTVGVAAGLAAGSIALVAFGLDSAIEGLASIIVIWRFTGARTMSSTAERRAQQMVAISFYLLAPYVAAEAIDTLVNGAVAETTWLGIGLTIGTLMICPWLGLAKQKIAERLGSGTVGSEGTQNILCAMLAGGVLVGLVANTVCGLWWLDPMIALVIAAVCVWEGRKTWQGQTCGCASCAIPSPSIVPDLTRPEFHDACARAGIHDPEARRCDPSSGQPPAT
jgi:divalent metal cation (Fe/Co/Zn/Cd) transporter